MTKEERINKLLEWMKTATKSERHIPEIEEFAKNNPKVFGEFHRLAGGIISGEDLSTKEKLVELINNNEEDIEIIIGDNGIGIKKEILDKVFEEFVRGDISRESSGGSGLGLAITKKIIELHKGKIILISDEGGGSKFKIILKK